MSSKKHRCKQPGSGGGRIALSGGQRKKYEQFRLEIVCFDSKDVLTTSGDNLGGWKDEWYSESPFTDNYGGN